MKTRKVPLNYRNVTGNNGSVKSDYSVAESTLEADFLTLLDFSKDVAYFRTQPVTIEYNKNDLRCTYTPDVKVESINSKITFYEVKYRKDLFKNWASLKPKFKAAIRYARENGAEFKIITEREIRTDYLLNIKFLKMYNVQECATSKHKVLEDMLAKLKVSTPNKLIQTLEEQGWSRVESLYNIWLVVALGELGKNNVYVDLYKRLTMDSTIWWQNE
ncbi:MAG TPA: TnsA endonuclease N-terminal domain-containing protein [Aquella sp.]|nr:TnsA endonuclease N-terminal domain-containing protein [Aquella sp.]